MLSILLAVSTYCNPLSIPDMPVGIVCRDARNGDPIAEKGWRHDFWLRAACGFTQIRQFRELADPVVSPFHTAGLIGTPNELKLKYLADNDFKDLSGEALKEAISASIRKKDGDLKGQMASEGTTPRQLTDLIGSLCDLTSGSGDKGTPVVLVQGYFDNYTNN